jgi:arsenate reductase
VRTWWRLLLMNKVPIKKVLVLCTGNSCRSIMAEALINELGAAHFFAQSAGSQPAGYVHPKSLETLARHGVVIEAVRSKSWDEFLGQEFDYVITVCDSAAAESCPYFAGACERLHWSIPDPAACVGTDAEIDAAFDRAFAMLHSRIQNELLSI